MDKTKILFCMQTMVVGGVEKELQTILKKFDKDKFDLTVLLFYVADESATTKIPENVRLIDLKLDADYWLSNTRELLKARFKRGKFAEAISLAVKTLKSGGTPTAFLNIEAMPEINESFDFAVCYHMHSGVVLKYVAEKIRATHKYVWIHNDFSISGFKIAKYNNTLNKYEKIVAVSNRLMEEFNGRCPNHSHKSTVIYNYLDSEDIIRKSEESTDSEYANDSRIKLLTVGRYVEQKGYDIAIKACKMLVDLGFDISWYAIGWGPEEDSMKKLVKENKLEDRFYILGRKENPYPYIKGCDLYLQPSRHEGYGLVLTEANALNKYIVATDFAGAREQIIDSSFGLIAESFSPEAVVESVKEAINNKLYSTKNAEKFIKSNERELQRIVSLFDKNI